MKRYILFIVIMSCFVYALNGNETTNKEILRQANQAYTQQRYTDAIALYSKIAENNYEGFELYYNLGNAYFKSNQIGLAILYYEKARKLNPSDEDLNFNLQVANSRIVDKIDVMPDIFIKTWGNNILSIFSADGWARITVGCFMMFFILLVIYLFSKTTLIRKISLWLSIIMLLTSFGCFILAKLQFNELNRDKEAIVFTPTINIKSSPDESSIDLFVIHEGLKVKITDRVNDWYEIRIPNGSKGWLKTTDVEII